VLSDFGLKRGLLAIRNHNSLDLSTALHDAHNGSLVFAASPGDSALAFCYVHVASFATDESFVRFYMAREFLYAAIVKRHADAMIQEPSGFLSNAQIAATRMS